MPDFDPTTMDNEYGNDHENGRGGDVLWNLLTFLLFAGILGAVAIFYILFQNPFSSINPYPPPTLPVPIVLPSNTPTQPQLPPTWTVVVTETQSPTLTPRPSNTPTTMKTELPTEGPTPTRTDRPTSNYSFDLQSAPTGIDAAVLYPERGCNWMGVGGQVVDLQGRPVTGITVQLGGNLDTEVLDQTSLTGLALKYGEAGYEFELAKTPAESKHTLWVRLIDQARLPLSQKIYFDTFEDCQRNLIIVNFRQIR